MSVWLQDHSASLQFQTTTLSSIPKAATATCPECTGNPQLVFEENLDILPCASSRNCSSPLGRCHSLWAAFLSLYSLEVSLCSTERKGPLSLAENRILKFRRQRGAAQGQRRDALVRCDFKGCVATQTVNPEGVKENSSGHQFKSWRLWALIMQRGLIYIYHI